MYKVRKSTLEEIKITAKKFQVYESTAEEMLKRKRLYEAVSLIPKDDKYKDILSLIANILLHG